MAFAAERDLARRAIDTARTRGASYADARRVPALRLAGFTFTGSTQY